MSADIRETDGAISRSHGSLRSLGAATCCSSHRARFGGIARSGDERSSSSKSGDVGQAPPRIVAWGHPGAKYFAISTGGDGFSGFVGLRPQASRCASIRIRRRSISSSIWRNASGSPRATRCPNRNCSSQSDFISVHRSRGCTGRWALACPHAGCRGRGLPEFA